ncbi:Methyl-accepting chemotaxis protein McpS [compost metagenome]
MDGDSKYEVDSENNEIRLAIPISIPKTGTKWSLLIKLPLDIVMSRAIEFQSRIVDSAKNDLIFMAFAGVAVTLGGIVLLWLMSFSVGRPLRNVAVRLSDIAEGEGDLTKELSTERADEIGAIGLGFNTFLSKLRRMISNTVELTNRIADASQRTLLISSNTDREVKLQLAAIELIATATQEMTATAHEVANNASKASHAASSADDSAKLGQKAVQESSQSTKVLQEEIRRALQLVRSLESDSEDINTILNTIRSIAEQTNLLALNAAIEAARAGDQGRGFAVVADEVRNLAIKTQLSTSEINLMIEKLNNGTREVVSAMERSAKCTEDSVRNSEQAADVLILITESVSLISEMNLQIASAAEEQSIVAEDISRNIVSISASTAGVARSAENTASASHALTKLSSEQLNLVQQFKF